MLILKFVRMKKKLLQEQMIQKYINYYHIINQRIIYFTLVGLGYLILDLLQLI